jgi:hypothetical protein
VHHKDFSGHLDTLFNNTQKKILFNYVMGIYFILFMAK